MERKHTAPVRRNDDIELTIDDIGTEGQGIGKYQGYTVFVPGALPGERVSAHIIKADSKFGIGKLKHIISEAPNRVQPRCAVFERCGGCTLQHLDYAAQLEIKRDSVKNALERIGGFKGIIVPPVIGMDEPWHYRNKGAMPVKMQDGRLEVGFFAPRSHTLIPGTGCIIHDKSIMSVAAAVMRWAAKHKISAYDETTRKGILRHIMARTSTLGEVMAVIVSNGELPRANELAQHLKADVPGIKSILNNINTQNTNAILGSRYKLIWGSEKLMEEICGVRLMISAASFLQINPEQTRKLYFKALEFAKLTGKENVVDLFCGIGSISLLLAKHAAHVTGIEIVEAAIEDANSNARLNGIDNADFICAPAELSLPRLVESGLKPDVIVLDPPRKGCEQPVLDTIIKSGAPRVVYVSCHPATLARDLKHLSENGYTLEAVQPVDLFPQTMHVECVTLMSRVEK